MRLIWIALLFAMRVALASFVATYLPARRRPPSTRSSRDGTSRDEAGFR